MISKGMLNGWYEKGQKSGSKNRSFFSALKKKQSKGIARWNKRNPNDKA